MLHSLDTAARQPGLHVAIIMDGNGRWAQARRLPRVAGHREGAKAVRKVVEAAPDLGIDNLTLYAEGEAAGGYRVDLHPGTASSPVKIDIISGHSDEALRTIFDDVRPEALESDNAAWLECGVLARWGWTDAKRALMEISPRNL